MEHEKSWQGPAAAAWARQMKAWHKEKRGNSGKVNSRKFWDGFDLWEAYEPLTGYPGELMTPILAHLTPKTRVLDVGSGAGALAIPMAGAAQQVTALEPSLGQIRRFQKKIADMGIKNINVVQQSWEDANSRELGPHGVVTAGYCLFMTDIGAALNKMVQLARKHVFLVHLAGHDLQKPFEQILGHKATLPDHGMLVRVLKEARFSFQSRIFRRDFALPLSLQMDMFRYTLGLTRKESDKVQRWFVQNNRLFKQENALWVRRQYRDALITVQAGGKGLQKGVSEISIDDC